MSLSDRRFIKELLTRLENASLDDVLATCSIDGTLQTDSKTFAKAFVMVINAMGLGDVVSVQNFPGENGEPMTIFKFNMD